FNSIAMARMNELSIEVFEPLESFGDDFYFSLFGGTVDVHGPHKEDGHRLSFTHRLELTKVSRGGP
ncbi:unnamed protein product, partial [Ilex paraguariensis]